MADYKLFHKIPKKAEFHSVVMTTYSFDFYHFESQVLKTLKTKGITNVNIFCDPVMLDQSIGYAMGYLKELSTSYSVNSISSLGAFHPKISLFAGDNHVMLLQGSGNITTGGHGKNHEIFSVFYADNENKEQLALIQEAWYYINYLTKGLKGFSSDKLRWVSDNCSLLKSDSINLHQFHNISNDFSAALLYNDDTSIFSQLKNLIPQSSVLSIKVFSPFYDENGSAIEKFLEHFKNAKIDVFVQKDNGIHPFKMSTSDRIKFYSWNSTNRAKSREVNSKLHAKILWIETDTDYYCMLGSANLTNRAFGDNKRGANDEFSVLVKAGNIDILEELELNGDYETIEPQDNNANYDIEQKVKEEQISNSSKMKLLSVDYDGKVITIYSRLNNNYNNVNCSVFDKWGNELFTSNITRLTEKYEIEIPSNMSNNASYLIILDEDNSPISNKQIINNLNELWGTNPSVENRKLMKLGSFIEDGRNGFFDVIDFYNILNISTTSKLKNSSNNSDTTTMNPDMQNISGLTYDEAIKIDKNSDDFNQIIKQHNTVKIWDAFEKYFNSLSILQMEEDMDDEEEGDAVDGRERKEVNQFNISIRLNSEKVLLGRRKKLVKFFNNYLLSLENSCHTKGYQVSLIDFAMYLIVVKQILDFVNRKVVFKEDNNNDDSVILPIKGNLAELDSFSGSLLNILGHFINLINHASLFHSSDEYTAKKMDHYIKITRRTSLFCLSIAKGFYIDDISKSKWFDALAYNIFNKLGLPDDNFNNVLDDLINRSNFNNLDKKNTVSIIDKWINEFQNIDSNKNYFIHQKLGICYINKAIPNPDSPKLLKLSRPGFLYDAFLRDFELENLYNLTSQTLVKSLQKYKRKDV